MINRLWKSKTARLAIAGILTAIGAYVGDEISVTEMGFAIFNGLGMLFLRDGIAKR